MKKSFAIILSGLLVIGAAGTIMAGSGSKCSKGASASQTIGATQATAAANTPAPAITSKDNACGGCPEAAKAAMKDSGCCPGKVVGASATQTAEKVCPKTGCDMKAKAECESKVEGSSVTPSVEQSSKKAS
jgi:hypothetical protein